MKSLRDLTDSANRMHVSRLEDDKTTVQGFQADYGTGGEMT